MLSLVSGVRRLELTQSQVDARRFIPASVILQELHDEAPADHVTLDWLMGSLHRGSFGLITLMLALGSAAPGIGFVAGPLLLIPALQMIAARPTPTFPHWIATRALPTRHLGAVVQRAIPVLKYLERAVHPRWPTPPEATKRVVGIAIMMLTVRLILSMIPLSNVIPALVIALIALAYLEEDGLVLSIGLMVGLVILAVDLGVLWNTVFGTKRIGRF